MTPAEKEARRPLLSQRLKLQHQLNEVNAALACKHCMDKTWGENQVKKLSSEIELINDELRVVSGQA